VARRKIRRHSASASTFPEALIASTNFSIVIDSSRDVNLKLANSAVSSRENLVNPIARRITLQSRPKEVIAGILIPS
jgi:hypothetical protein